MKKSIYICTLFLFILISCSSTEKIKWTKENKSKLTELNLTKNEVIVLASIIEKETKNVNEKPKIAGVYLNRLKKNMPLQSNPTITFAIGDTVSKRLLMTDIETKSPYNTYINKGLPPGPICKPSKESLLAVLNADKNNYLFFCHKPNLPDYFNYAETYKEHIANAKLNSLN